MLNLNQLDNYHIIFTGESVDLAASEDARELEGQWGRGVHLVWSDAAYSIIAVAFDQAVFTEEGASKWMADSFARSAQAAQAMQGAFTGARAILPGIKTIIADAIKGLLPKPAPAPIAARSFDDSRRLLRASLDEAFPSSPDESGYAESVWIIDMGPDTAIVEISGRRYAQVYSIDENDAVTLGTLTPIEKTWVRKADGVPVMLHAFGMRLADAGDQAEDDGLIWKRLIIPGTWFHCDSSRPVTVTADMIMAAHEAFQDGLPQLVSIPTDGHHHGTGGIVPAESNRGFVRKTKLADDGAMFGGLDITNEQTRQGVSEGSIADCSVYLRPQVTHPASGKTYPWILTHVLLTNFPLAQGLGPFTDAIPASGDGAGFVVRYSNKTGGTIMPDQVQIPEGGRVIDAAAAGRFDAFAALGADPAALQTMLSQQAAIAATTRDLRVSRIVRALEGLEEHDQVTGLEGFRHYPVVISAVETALREQPEAIGLAADEQGATTLDAVVLSIVNALPNTARMASQRQDPPPKKNDPVGAEGGDVTEDQIDHLDKQLQ